MGGPQSPRKPKRPEKPSAGRRTLELLATEAIATGAASSYEDLLDQVADVRDRKLFNSLLAILQMPHASMMCSAQVWAQKWGRRILHGQRPLVLMARFGPVEFVYDVSQTEAAQGATPLPLDASPFAMSAVVEAGELLARLVAGLVEHGVQVVRARQGVALAGKIVRVTKAGVQPLPGDGAAVPVRWVVALNETHPPTEQLATIGHELGHLFCGHVGADEGDPWPVRDEGLDHRTREFEAESVARLVFGRIAPRAELPPYLEHILLPGEPVPDHGWSYVAKAADKILDLLGVEPDRAIVLAPSEADLKRPAWLADLIIRRGGPSALEMVVIQAWGLPQEDLARRIAAAWTDAVRPDLVPWTVLVTSEAALDAIDDYFDHAAGEKPEHDAYMAGIESFLPLRDHWLTVLRLAPNEQSEDIVFTTDPPAENGIFSACADDLAKRGFATTAHEANTSWMYDSWGEQTLGWDDMYSNGQWRHLEDSARLFVNLKLTEENIRSERLGEIAEVITGRRIEYHNYLNGYEEGDPQALVREAVNDGGQGLLF